MSGLLWILPAGGGWGTGRLAEVKFDVNHVMRYNARGPIDR